jgi:hypothetical protein
MLLCESAIKLASLGFPILPLAQGAKVPLTAKGFKDASSDQKIIQSWWNQSPQANIGLVVGGVSNICVLDIDPRNGGDDSLAKLINKYGSLPETVEVITGGGGRHYYFKYDKNFGVEQEFSKGIDCRKNGYVVAPPSVHFSGAQYRFVEGKALGEIPIAMAPGWLLKGGVRSEKQPIRELYEDVAEGGRNNALARIIGVNIKLGLNPSDCLALALSVNQRYKPPLIDGEVKGIVESIWRTHSLSVSALVAQDKSMPESLAKFLKRDIPPVEYWIKNIIKKQGRTIISAATNKGKSIFAQHISLAIAMGMDSFLGQFKTEKANVLYLDFEMGESVLHERFNKMTSIVGVPDNLYVKFMLGKNLQNEQTKECLEKWITDLGAKLLVIDPIGSAWTGDENSKQEVAILTSYFDSLIDKYGLSIHHWRKASKDSKSGGAMAAGSYKWEAGVDHHITLDGEIKHMILSCEKSRTGPKFEKMIIGLNPDTILFEFIGKCKGKYTVEDVVRIFKEMGQEKVSMPALIKYSKEHNGPGKDKIRAIVRSSNKFIVEETGKTHLVSLVDNSADYTDCFAD